MTQILPAFASNAAALEARLGLLVLRLSLEVARLRALRADGRSERFAGVLMRDEDIADLLAEMAGANPADMAAARDHLVATQSRYEARLAAMPLQPPFERLADIYGMTVAEKEVLLLAMAPSVDPRFGRVLGFLHEDMTQQHATLGLAQRCLGDLGAGGIGGLRASIAAGGTLVRHGFIEVSGKGPLVAQALNVPDSILEFMIDRRPVCPEGGVIVPCGGTPDWPTHPQLVVSQTDQEGVVGAGLKGPLWLIEQGQMSLPMARIAGVGAALNGAHVVYLGWDAAPEQDRHALMQSLGRHSVVVTHRPALWEGHGVAWSTRDDLVVDHRQRTAFWSKLLAPSLAEPLARERVLGVAALWRLALEADGSPNPAQRIITLLRHRGSEPMQGLADRIATPFGIESLVLPAATKARLKGFAARRASMVTVLEDWGLGPSLGAGRGGIGLFTGPSGVGKTMSAGVVAKMAGLDLWRINLATLVSKYIGETQANLERIFVAAAEADVLLFFDEAESLFSKRAEVKDARDRYANLEMSYLLQRLEDFPGMAVLASNMGSAMDPAMLRRFDLVLEFSMPDAEARRDLWAKIETGTAPLAEDVDLDLIAETFELAGGHIKQAILAAAHEAAQAGTKITQVHLLAAVAREYVKLGRTLRRDDFGPSFGQIRRLV